MQIDHKIAIIRLLRTIQLQYNQDSDRMQTWLDFEKKVSLEIDSYSLSHKLALFKSLKLFLRSVQQIQTAKHVIAQTDHIINR
ncbi:MAG: hypothetical protein NW226_12265 [Microscillaceae bacterium]|nr:hypothetical protein [Microscillaceae bacterium]